MCSLQLLQILSRFPSSLRFFPSTRRSPSLSTASWSSLVITILLYLSIDDNSSRCEQCRGRYRIDLGLQLEELLFDHQFRSHPTETDKEENSSSAVDGSIQIFGQSQGSAIVVCTWTDGEVLSSDRRFSSEFSRFHILHYSSMYSRSSRVKFLTVEGNGDNVSSTKPSSRSLQEFLLKHCFFPTANMKVITAIYLHVRPDLRDEWLAGVDVDTDVEESLVRLSPFLSFFTL